MADMGSGSSSAVNGRMPVRKFKRVLPKLKEVEILGFIGYKADIELGRYLLQNAAMLDKFVINVLPPSCVGTPEEFDDLKEMKTAVKRTKKLEKFVPPQVDFRVCSTY